MTLSMTEGVNGGVAFVSLTSFDVYLFNSQVVDDGPDDADETADNDDDYFNWVAERSVAVRACDSLEVLQSVVNSPHL